VEATPTLSPVTPPPGRPNLVIDSFTITPEGICVQDEATFEFSVSNTGGAPAEDFFLMLNYVRGEEGSTGSYQGPFFRLLVPGDTANASTSHVLDSAGEYTFTAVVDADNNVAEENETDNESEVVIDVC
jgi:subtilase family serine protease